MLKASGFVLTRNILPSDLPTPRKMHCNSFGSHLYRSRGEQLYSIEQPSTSGLKLQFQSQLPHRQGQSQLVCCALWKSCYRDWAWLNSESKPGCAHTGQNTCTGSGRLAKAWPCAERKGRRGLSAGLSGYVENAREAWGRLPADLILHLWFLLQHSAKDDSPYLQVVEELLAYWKLEDADDTLEELEEILIVSQSHTGSDIRRLDVTRFQALSGSADCSLHLTT